MIDSIHNIETFDSNINIETFDSNINIETFDSMNNIEHSIRIIISNIRVEI
jgi:hypothetical protein